MMPKEKPSKSDKRSANKKNNSGLKKTARSSVGNGSQSSPKASDKSKTSSKVASSKISKNTKTGNNKAHAKAVNKKPATDASSKKTNDSKSKNSKNKATLTGKTPKAEKPSKTVAKPSAVIKPETEETNDESSISEQAEQQSSQASQASRASRGSSKAPAPVLTKNVATKEVAKNKTGAKSKPDEEEEVVISNVEETEEVIENTSGNGGAIPIVETEAANAAQPEPTDSTTSKASQAVKTEEGSTASYYGEVCESGPTDAAVSNKVEDSSAKCNENYGAEKDESANPEEREPVSSASNDEELKDKIDENLQFTKPTINQIKKEKKDKPISFSEKITNREYEILNDEINELNSGMQMLKHSYGSIIKSLVAMQNRRTKKKARDATSSSPSPLDPDKPVTFLTTLSTMDATEMKTKSCLEATEKFDIERFLNPVTREETFNALFDEIEDLNKQSEKFRTTFFDARGRFIRDKYDAQTEIKVDRTQYNEFRLWAKKLAAVVDDIARNYNDDLLNMFRLN